MRDPRAGTKKPRPAAWPDKVEVAGRAYAPASVNFLVWKHSRQKTGRPCVGLNGTVVSLPQAEQFVVVSTRSLAMPPAAEGRDARLALHDLHRFGSFLKFLSAKKSCSPAVQTNSAPQSTQLSDLSWNSIGPASHAIANRPLEGRSDPPGRLHGRTGYCPPLFDLATQLLARALPRQRLLRPTTISGLQIEGVLLDILDDIFLLHLALEAAKRAFDRFAFLNFDFSQA